MLCNARVVEGKTKSRTRILCQHSHQQIALSVCKMQMGCLHGGISCIVFASLVSRASVLSCVVIFF